MVCETCARIEEEKQLEEYQPEEIPSEDYYPDYPSMLDPSDSRYRPAASENCQGELFCRIFELLKCNIKTYGTQRFVNRILMQVFVTVVKESLTV